MNKTLESDIVNWLRVCGARNERDLQQVMKIVLEIFTYASSLESRLVELENAAIALDLPGSNQVET